MVGATVAIGFVSMGVWAHHMFTVGMTSAANTFFVIATMAVGVPTGIKIFNWLGDDVGRQDPLRDADALLHRVPVPVPDRRADRHHAGRRPVRLAARATRTSSSRTSTTCWSAALVFTIFARIYYWFPKATGRMLDETLGKWHFWLFVIGFHLTFDPMHIPGLLGMPRRIYTYEAGRGWDDLESDLHRRRGVPGRRRARSSCGT